MTTMAQGICSNKNCPAGNKPIIRDREYIDGDYYCVTWHCLSCGRKEERRHPRLGTPAWKEYEKRKEEEAKKKSFTVYTCAKCNARVRTIGGTPVEAWCDVCKRWMDFKIVKGDGNGQTP